MRLPSLEDLAERWTLSHTIAVAAWSIVVVLGLLLLVHQAHDPYPAVDRVKTYAGENATFAYPENWTVNNCENGKSFIELPGAIETHYKGKRSYPLTMYASGAYNCIKDRPERFDLYPENLTASDTPCAPSTSTTGEKLDNGLYLQVQEQGGKVFAVYIKQNSCYAPADTVVLGFGFTDPEAKEGDTEEFGIPRVDKEVFLASKQYQHIRSLAQSIRY